MIAAMLGYDRGSYYSLFSDEESKIALQVRAPVRRTTNALSYLMTDKPVTLKKLRGMSARIPVHVDMLLSGERALSQLEYRVFFNHKDGGLMEELKSRVRNRKFAYPPSLGTANNLAEVEYVDCATAELRKLSGVVEVSTVVPLSVVRGVYPQEGLRILREELVPADFGEGRELKRLETYIYEAAGRPMRLLVEGEVFTCVVKGERVVGTFM